LRKLTALTVAAASVAQPFALYANQTPAPLAPVSPSASLGTSVEAELELLAADNETVRLATDQFRAGDFEDAQATLATVKVDELSASDRRAYDRLSARVTEAVEGRRTARSNFEKGESLLAEGKLAEAIAAYKSASGNKFVDSATRTKSLEQIALAETQRRSAEIADRAIYGEAVEAFKAGDYASAKSKFQQLADRGFKAGMFQRSPADYLKEIDKATGASAAAPAAAAPAGEAAAAAAPAGPTAKDLYQQGVSQFDNKDFAAAKVSFEAAIAAGYRPGFLQRSPADYIARIDRELAAAAPAAAPAAVVTPAPAAPVASAAPEAPAAATPAPAAAAPAAPAPAATPAAPSPSSNPPGVVVEGGATPAAAPAAAAAAPDAVGASTPSEAANGAAFYEAGVRQFREGNLDEAEKNFAAAKDAGYRPGLFQDSTDRWLNRIADRRVDLANAEKAATLAAAQKAERETAAAKSGDAKRLYQAGVENYRKGDWIEARKNFAAAVDAGYKTGLFETSPQTYLARMDKKESADAAKAAVAAAPAPASPGVTVEGQPAAPVTPAAPVAPVAPAANSAAQAAELVVQARAAQANGENAKALELYTQAANLDPSNAAAVAGRDELANAPAPAVSLLTEQERQIKARREVVQYQFDQAIATAKEATAKGAFPEAMKALEQARIARNQDPTIFTPAELAGFDSTIATTSTDLSAAEKVRATADAELAAKQQVDAEKARIERILTERENTVAALIKQSRDLTSEMKYEEALKVVDQILAIDPANDYALGVRPLIEDRAIISQQRRYQDTFNRQLMKQFNKAEEIRIPYDDLLRFPDNWPDISEMRDLDNASRRGETALDTQTLAILDRKIPELRFDGVAFGDVVDFLRDVTGANLFVEWRTLEQAGIDRTTPVTVTRLTNIRFEKALQTVLREVSGGGTPLDYNIEEGIITISTREAIAQASPRTVVYDVSDLLFRPLDAGDPPDVEFELEAVERGGGGGGGGNLFGGDQGGGEGQFENRPPETILAELVGLIEQLVTPDQWATNGGTGNIRPFQTGSSYSMIVTATRNSHRELESLLNKLRTSQAVQVSVEARFLQISRSYLEDIGLDIDVDLNLGGVISDKLGSFTGPNGGFVNRVPIQQGSASFTENPRTGLPSAITSPAPSIQVQGAYIDDFAVSFLLRATQASVNSSIAQAPRITLFSGQRSRVIVGEYQFFVTDLTPVVGTGAVAFQPDPSAVFTGVELWVQAVVSADRKYVQLNLVPRLRQLLSVQNFTFQTAAAGTDGGTGGTLPPGTVVPVAGIATATIQLPTQRFVGVYTSASVPDGGTVLLGGLTIGGEVENEQGVPILSKIPFLKRLFTNRSTAKDEQVLLIMVKPTIIIQKELENKQFPLLSNRVMP
jgi:general secretion pathway protein D